MSASSPNHATTHPLLDDTDVTDAIWDIRNETRKSAESVEGIGDPFDLANNSPEIHAREGPLTVERRRAVLNKVFASWYDVVSSRVARDSHEYHKAVNFFAQLEYYVHKHYVVKKGTPQEYFIIFARVAKMFITRDPDSQNKLREMRRFVGACERKELVEFLRDLNWLEWLDSDDERDVSLDTQLSSGDARRLSLGERGEREWVGGEGDSPKNAS